MWRRFFTAALTFRGSLPEDWSPTRNGPSFSSFTALANVAPMACSKRCSALPPPSAKNARASLPSLSCHNAKRARGGPNQRWKTWHSPPWPPSARSSRAIPSVPISPGFLWVVMVVGPSPRKIPIDSAAIVQICGSIVLPEHLRRTNIPKMKNIAYADDPKSYADVAPKSANSRLDFSWW
jgi:hypothetical protein